jgi:hypothetical protein
MRKLLLLVILTLSTCICFSQNSFKKNAVYGELAGQGLWLSANYERQLSGKPGFGIHIGGSWGNIKPIISTGCNYLFKLKKKDKSFVEAGAGLTLTEASFLSLKEVYNNNYTGLFIPSIGYRHHTHYGLMWKIVYSPAFSSVRTIPFDGGFSLGWRF